MQYGRLLEAIEAAREVHEGAEPAGDAAAVLLVEVGNLLARCEVIVRALVNDEGA